MPREAAVVWEEEGQIGLAALSYSGEVVMSNARTKRTVYSIDEGNTIR